MASYKELEEKVLHINQIAESKSLKFSFAESCTGGLLSALTTSQAGSSSVFDGGIVSYSNRIKHQILGVKNETLDEFGAVSEQTTYEMAFGLKDLMQIDIAISVSGIAGPGGAVPGKPVGTVCFGIAYLDEVHTYTEHFEGSREDVRLSSCLIALELLENALGKF